MPESESRLGILEQRINTVVNRVDLKLDSITELLQGLVRLEERQLQANEKLNDISKAVADHDLRLRNIEVVVPQLKEARTWVVSGVLAGTGMIGTAVYHLVMKG